MATDNPNWITINDRTRHKDVLLNLNTVIEIYPIQLEDKSLGTRFRCIDDSMNDTDEGYESIRCRMIPIRLGV